MTDGALDRCADTGPVVGADAGLAGAFGRAGESFVAGLGQAGGPIGVDNTGVVGAHIAGWRRGGRAIDRVDIVTGATDADGLGAAVAAIGALLGGLAGVVTATDVAGSAIVAAVDRGIPALTRDDTTFAVAGNSVDTRTVALIAGVGWLAGTAVERVVTVVGRGAASDSERFAGVGRFADTLTAVEGFAAIVGGGTAFDTQRFAGSG